MGIEITFRRLPDVHPEAIQQSVRKALFRGGETIKRRARSNLSNRVLRRRTGRLANSVTSRMAEGPTSAVVVGTNVFYGEYHEFGKPGPWVIAPARKKALSFIWHGRRVVFGKVVHPGLIERPWLRPALMDSRPDIIEGFEQELRGAAIVTGGANG